jgi:acetyltransferase
MEKMIAYCRKRGMQQVVGEVLTTNRAMLTLAKRLGFVSQQTGMGDVVSLVLDLTKDQAPQRQAKAG